MEAHHIAKQKPPAAFVINMGANGLGIARSLGRRRIPIVGVDSNPRVPGLSSRYVRPLLCKDIVKEPDAVLETLMAEGERLGGRSVLLPASDAAVLFISRNRSSLAACFDFIIPSQRVQEAMVNKRLQYEEAVRIGIPMTETIYPRSMGELENEMHKLQYPAFIKPLYSHLWYFVFGNKGFIVNDEEDLREKMAKVFAAGQEVMVQDIIQVPGQDLYNAAAYIGKDGYVSPIITWHKVRQYPPNFGVGSLVSTCHQPEVAALGMKFMKGLGYQGIASVGFKKDKRDGGWKLIELNARTWMQNEISDRAGIPLVYLEYLDLIGESKPILGDFIDGVRWWDGMSDTDSFWRLRRRNEITALQWLRSWSGAEIHAYYAADDLRPVLRRYGYGVELAKMTYNLLKMKTDEDAMPGMDGMVELGAIKVAEAINDEAKGLKEKTF